MASVLTPRWYDAFVAVWRRPWMSLASDTYGSSLLDVLGVSNVFADSVERYPEVTLAEVAARAPNLDPAAERAVRVRARARPRRSSGRSPGVPIVFVDGRDLFWWGIRTPAAAARLAAPCRWCVADPHGVWVCDASESQGADLGIASGVTVVAPGVRSRRRSARYHLCETRGGRDPGTWSARRCSSSRPGRPRSLAIPWLQRATSSPTRRSGCSSSLLLACSAANAAVQAFEGRLSPTRRAAPPRRDRRDQHRVGRVRDRLGIDPRDRLRRRHRRPAARARFARVAARVCCGAASRSSRGEITIALGWAPTILPAVGRARGRGARRSSASRSSRARSARRRRRPRRRPRRSNVTARTSATSCSTRPT